MLTALVMRPLPGKRSKRLQANSSVGCKGNGLLGRARELDAHGRPEMEVPEYFP
jgi:hypothetical protein